MNKITLIVLLAFIGIGLQAQDTLIAKSFFKKRDFGQYFYSDRYAPITNVGIGAMALFDTYDIGLERNGVVPVAEPILGAQLPIYYFKDESKRWSLSIPISFSVWFDFTEERTSPILNTDYRFALLELNYTQILEDSKINNIGLRFIPFFHESTHIGDELIISKIRDSIPVSRINVSYETFELAFIINDAFGQKVKNHSARLGAKFLWNPQKGYYTADSLEISKSIEIPSSSRWIEPYLQYQYQNPDSWLSNNKMMFIFSQDFYLRVRYGYGSYFTNESEEVVFREIGEAYQLCSTTMLGWKFYNYKKELSNSGVFFKIYIGLNPHGQFRNIPKYPWVGLNWVYDI
ncbi:DUF1207 domain-containing protein [Lentimicrobium sp. L6]|uniref:DUF1207 domain-containing protein n=1 Tax=Lentimicrobium sp. L6 TaxID=2735916 RepID=UPI001551D7B2|nr:DUF1207 domain-containing protein [Lentimicrobium sp. L6]NPD86386.1 DUF1207 domain-containing protein [Lentimicrobium sp. L6]